MKHGRYSAEMKAIRAMARGLRAEALLLLS
jgi:hypothetical protein